MEDDAYYAAFHLASTNGTRHALLIALVAVLTVVSEQRCAPGWPPASSSPVTSAQWVLLAGAVGHVVTYPQDAASLQGCVASHSRFSSSSKWSVDRRLPQAAERRARQRPPRGHLQHSKPIQ